MSGYNVQGVVVKGHVDFLANQLRDVGGDPITATAHLVAAISRATGTNRRHWTVHIDGCNPTSLPYVRLDYDPSGRAAEHAATLKLALSGDSGCTVIAKIGETYFSPLPAVADQTAEWLDALKAVFG